MKTYLIAVLTLLITVSMKAQSPSDLVVWVSPLQIQLQEKQFFEYWSQGKQDSTERYLSILILCETENKLYHYWLGRAYTATLVMQKPASLEGFVSYSL